MWQEWGWGRQYMVEMVRFSSVFNVYIRYLKVAHFMFGKFVISSLLMIMAEPAWALPSG
jgi:hypothetical protein